jgi:predicted secreted Zn-dependent protease
MSLHYVRLATVAIILSCYSSTLMAGEPDNIRARKLMQKRPEVSSELKVKEKYQYYDVEGISVAELRSQMKQNGTKWNDGKVYAALTSWDIRYSWDVFYEDGKCFVKSVKTDVEITYALPRRIPMNQDPTFTAMWNDYVVRLKEHEFGHKDIAVKTASEINQEIASLEGFESEWDLEREAKRRAGDKLRQLKTLQVVYDDETRHGETQGAILASN